MSAPSTVSSNTVTIACKLPAGFFMQAYGAEDVSEPVIGGGTRTVKRHFPVGEKIRIFGTAKPFGQEARTRIVAGYAMTDNVPADIAKAWFKANEKNKLVTNGMVLMHEKRDMVAGEAREKIAIRSGLERLDVSTTHRGGRDVPVDPRWPRSNNANVTMVQSDKRDAA